MIKWFRVYVSLKVFKRGDPPIVIHVLWHQNLNKEIFVWDYTLSSFDVLMICWLVLIFFYTQFMPGYILYIFLHPSICRLKEAHLRITHRWGDSLCAGSWVLCIGEWFFLDDFSFPVLFLCCISHLFVLLIDFFGLRGTLGSLTEA